MVGNYKHTLHIQKLEKLGGNISFGLCLKEVILGEVWISRLSELRNFGPFNILKGEKSYISSTFVEEGKNNCL